MWYHCTCDSSGSLAVLLDLTHVRRDFHVSERRDCVPLGQHRSTQRKVPTRREDEERLTPDIIELTRQYGRYILDTKSSAHGA
jgi:hypothetical protein